MTVKDREGHCSSIRPIQILYINIEDVLYRMCFQKNTKSYAGYVSNILEELLKIIVTYAKSQIPLR